MKKLIALITNPVIDPKVGGAEALDNPLAFLFVNLWRAIIIAGALATLVYLLWGAFDWLTSEGDKEKYSAARSKIIHAIAGMAFLAGSVAIVYLIDNLGIFGFSLLKLEWTPES